MQQSRYRVHTPDSIIPISSKQMIPRTRPHDTLRPLFIKTSVIQQASGSCYIETQNIKIICSIYGPKQSTSSLNKPITCEYTSAPFSKTKHASLQKSQSDKEIALIIESCFEGCLIMGPKMGVDVFVMVLEEDGRMATIGNAVTSISLGLMDAGVEMKDSIIGVSCGFHDDKIIMDCTQVDEEIPFVDPLNSTLDKMDAIECKKVCLNGGMFLAYMPNMNQVAHIIQSGEQSTDLAIKSIQVCVDAALQVYDSIQKFIIQ